MKDIKNYRHQAELLVPREKPAPGGGFRKPLKKTVELRTGCQRTGQKEGESFSHPAAIRCRTKYFNTKINREIKIDGQMAR